MVRAIHERVTGMMPDGTDYAAGDPHLLRWVHIAEIESFLLAHRRLRQGRPLDQAERDEYVAQAAEIARRLGVVDPPTNEADLHAAVDAFRPELRATDHAREAAAYLIRHPELPYAARPGYWVLVASAVGLMPAWTRDALDLPRLPVGHGPGSRPCPRGTWARARSVGRRPVTGLVGRAPRLCFNGRRGPTSA